MANQTPDANVTYRVYNAGQFLIGTAQIDLPAINSMTAEVKGAGIAGAIDKSIIGMFQAMSMTFNFRTFTAGGIELLYASQQHLECWAAVQETDPGTGKFVVKQHKIVTRGEFKNLSPGKLSVAETQDRSIEMEVVYFKEDYGGVEHIEIDKYNHIYRVDGVDQLSAVRAAIGM